MSGFTTVQPEANGWFAVGVWIIMLTGAIHTFCLDKINGDGK
ncbi:hypothetical protein ACIO1C_02290 [Streptomyces sp. NPDC087420]